MVINISLVLLVLVLTRQAIAVKIDHGAPGLPMFDNGTLPSSQEESFSSQDYRDGQALRMQQEEILAQMYSPTMVHPIYGSNATHLQLAAYTNAKRCFQQMALEGKYDRWFWENVRETSEDVREVTRKAARGETAADSNSKASGSSSDSRASASGSSWDPRASASSSDSRPSGTSSDSRASAATSSDSRPAARSSGVKPSARKTVPKPSAPLSDSGASGPPTSALKSQGRPAANKENVYGNSERLLDLLLGD